MLWKGFQKPKRLEVDRETQTDHYGRFFAQPFERVPRSSWKAPW